jgi:hypothetical protein
LWKYDKKQFEDVFPEKLSSSMPLLNRKEEEACVSRKETISAYIGMWETA